MKERSILLGILLFLTIVNILILFWDTKKQQEIHTVTITTQKEYTLPASIKITIQNPPSGKNITGNSCNHLTIKYGNTPIPLRECQDITVLPGSSYTLDLSKDYDKFLQTGNYFITLKIHEQEYYGHFEITNPNWMQKLYRFFFYAPTYNAMAFILKHTNFSLWFSIILITLIIRIILLYPQHKMLVSQKKLQELQPKIEEIQTKYKWDYARIGMEMMELYKKHNVSPFGSCWLILIQMPILIVIYQVILYIEAPTNVYYLYSALKDYNPLSLETHFYGIDLMKIGWMQGMIIAIILGIIQYIQIKLSLYYTKRKNTTPPSLATNQEQNPFLANQEMLNKMMLYVFPAMIAVFSYSFFAAMSLYWGVSTLFTIIQQIIVNMLPTRKEVSSLHQK